VYRVVSPILGAYTVADAVHVMPALTVAMNVGNDERNNHALYEAQWLGAGHRAISALCQKPTFEMWVTP